MNIKVYKLILFIAILTITVSCWDDSNDYLTIDGTSYFYSVIMQSDGRLKMQLSPVSIPAMFNYKSKKEQEYYLSPGEKIKLFIDKDKVAFHEFIFVEFKEGYVYGKERTFIEGLPDKTFKVKFKQYPKIHLENS